MASDSGRRRAASGGAALRRMIATIRAAMSPRASRREYRVDLRIARVMHSEVMHQSVSTLSLGEEQRRILLLRDSEGVDLPAIGCVTCARRKDSELTAADGTIDSELI